MNGKRSTPDYRNWVPKGMIKALAFLVIFFSLLAILSLHLSAPRWVAAVLLAFDAIAFSYLLWSIIGRESFRLPS